MDLKKIREHLDIMDWDLLVLLATRLLLVREVAEQKRGKGPIHAPEREAEIFSRVADDCHVLGLDPDYILEIVSLIIAHAKDAECDVLGIDTFFN
mgnify:CR=1 FL=1